MRLLFLGDIGIPSAPPHHERQAAPWTGADLVIANLEGAILDRAQCARAARRNFVALHNDPAVIEYLQSLSVGAVALANNHVYDFDVPIGATQQRLRDAGIASFGAGVSLDAAAAPASFQLGGTRVLLFGFGWQVIGCRGARAQGEGVNSLKAARALEVAHRARSEDPDAFIVFIMHWNYELELYPQPAHRQLAHDLIAAGVDAIVGGHPHVAEGVEMVGGKPVAYSLGNWLFPPREVRGFHVQYPAFAQRQLALELAIDGRTVRDVRLHWHRFDPETWRIGHIGTENVDGEMSTKLTPYRGMMAEEYVAWFRTHRTRRRGLPIYADYRSPVNRAYDGYLRARQGAGEVLVRLGLKAEQRRRGVPARAH